MTAYAGTAELARILKFNRPSTPTSDQLTAMERVLDAATYEINSECNGDGTVYFGTPYPALAVEVCLERAVEHWNQQEAPFGLVGIGDAIPVLSARNSWERHAMKLAPLTTTWGIG